MKDNKIHIMKLLFGLLLTCYTSILFTQDQTNDSVDALSPFAKLIGGEWHLDGSVQVFEWGVGKLSVKSTSYFIINEEPQIVSEGIWFWHPGERKIKGYASAIEMPVQFFDYTTKYEGNKMVHALTSYTPKGTSENYTETWEFIDEDHYSWSLFTDIATGQQKIMGGTYERVKSPKQD